MKRVLLVLALVFIVAAPGCASKPEPVQPPDNSWFRPNRRRNPNDYRVCPRCGDAVLNSAFKDHFSECRGY